MSTEIRGKRDPAIEAVTTTLGAYVAVHPRADIVVYRHNSVSIRVRIIDPDFAGISRPDRHDAVWSYLEALPEDILSQISILLALTPDEQPTSIGSLDFDHPLPSRL